MPRGTKRKCPPKVTFHRNFRPPTANERDDAIGPFPGAVHTSDSRREMLLRVAADCDHDRTLINRPSLSELSSSTESIESAMKDLDDESLYTPVASGGKGRPETSLAIAHPRDELDWLAQVPEEGQTFEDYVTFSTSRSGRMRPIVNATGEEIVLLPLVTQPTTRQVGGDGSEEGGDAGLCWPEHGPPLDSLADYTRSFFDREVIVLPPAVVASAPTASTSKNPRFDIKFPKGHGGGKGRQVRSHATVVGRFDKKTKRMQLQVESLLEELAAFREKRGASGTGRVPLSQQNSGNPASSAKEERNFCVMGVTMVDLYDGPSDLFCAGMAYGGSKVAIFSFSRYHPCIKMSPWHWHDYFFADKADSYSYYENSSQAKKSKKQRVYKSTNKDEKKMNPTSFDEMKSLKESAGAEFTRRSAKLLTHELCHLYGIDHCIHNRCLMNGTGHLVEDFLAPCVLCGVCLRKLQWRLGFDVRGRYELLAKSFDKMGMKKEHKWALKQCSALAKSD
mmetsp:Transcript_63351/g.187206  ORF Transcript_63351/g.187206 Transcript_63351/m.187206 type:complete len:506 (-) Transcript_63351:782-2299(-)